MISSHWLHPNSKCTLYKNGLKSNDLVDFFSQEINSVTKIQHGSYNVWCLTVRLMVWPGNIWWQINCYDFCSIFIFFSLHFVFNCSLNQLSDECKIGLLAFWGIRWYNFCLLKEGRIITKKQQCSSGLCPFTIILFLI